MPERARRGAEGSIGPILGPRATVASAGDAFPINAGDVGRGFVERYAEGAVVVFIVVVDFTCANVISISAINLVGVVGMRSTAVLVLAAAIAVIVISAANVVAPQIHHAHSEGVEDVVPRHVGAGHVVNVMIAGVAATTSFADADTANYIAATADCTAALESLSRVGRGFDCKSE